MTKRATNLSVVLATVVGILILAEVSARVLGWGQVMEYVPSDIWGYTMKPSQRVSSYGHPVITNSMGLRGPEVRAQKSPETVRLLYVGDSVTYGGGRIRESDLFCRIAEQNLKDDGYDVEVINLSAPGWSPQNWSGYVEANGLFEADAVVLVLPECDLARGFATMSTNKFVESAPMFRIVAIANKVLMMLPNRRPPRDDSARRDPEDEVSANVHSVLTLKQLCERDGTTLVPVFVPTIRSLGYSGYWSQFEIILGDVLDLRAQLDATLFLDGVHLNKGGHRIVGDRITERLRDVIEKRV